MGFRGVVFSDDIGMAAAFSAGGVKQRIHDHLDAGCDVVLVCHPSLVEESLRAMEDRTLDTAVVAGLMGRAGESWGDLLAAERYHAAQAAIDTVPVFATDAGATSGANDAANAT